MLDIEGVYSSYLEEKNTENRAKYDKYKNWFSASSAGSCFKKQLLKKEGKEEPKLDRRVMRLLRLGTIVHEDIQKSIEDSILMSDIDYKIMMEERIELPDLNVVGHLDIGVLDRTTGELKVMDIKTCASYKWRVKFGRKPDLKGSPKYNLQLATYTHALSEREDVTHKEMSLIWYNKDTSALREEIVDNDWIEDALIYWEDLNERCTGKESEDLNPGEYGVPFENWECRYCGFKDIHCEGVK